MRDVFFFQYTEDSDPNKISAKLDISVGWLAPKRSIRLHLAAWLSIAKYAQN